MFRARVMAQGFTVVAMVAGSMYYSKDREKSKELRKLKEQREAEEKRQKWIRELEARDEEERALKEHLHKKAAAAAGVSAEDESKAEAGESTAGTGGILGRMGLWSHGEKKAAEEAQAQEEAKAKEEDVAATESAATDKKSRNPKSSLGTIGEIMASQKKDEPKK